MRFTVSDSRLALLNQLNRDVDDQIEKNTGVKFPVGHLCFGIVN